MIRMMNNFNGGKIMGKLDNELVVSNNNGGRGKVMNLQNNALVLSDNTKREDIFEEDIYIENIGVLRYSLSNDIYKIQEAIYRRTGNDNFIFIDEYCWRLNPELSNNVKRVMNRLNVNYSMTCFNEYSVQYLVINKREGNKWYITGYELE